MSEKLSYLEVNTTHPIPSEGEQLVYIYDSGSELDLMYAFKDEGKITRFTLETWLKSGD